MQDIDRRDELTTGDVARTLGVTNMTVLRYVERGILTCRTLPSGHRRFRRADVEELVRRGEHREVAS